MNWLDVNPYIELPALVDRDLVLYEPKVMMEYLMSVFRIHHYCPVTLLLAAEESMFGV